MRKGSFASGIYTLIYFGVSSVTISLFLYDEKRYLGGETETPENMSFIGNTPTTVIFNIMLLLCASFGIFASIFLIIGLFTDCRLLLLPWIMAMGLDVFVEASHFLYVVVFENVELKVLTAFIFTVDFFVVLLNVYCLFCVVSQYQEYKAGRGMRKESFVDVTDVNFVPSTDIVSPNNANPSKTGSSLMCGHTNCNLPELYHDESMKYVDEILPWHEHEYDPNNC